MIAAPDNSRTLRRLLKSEAGGGLVLIAASALALIVANSPWASAYFAALGTYLGPLSLLHWINDLLMAGFFLLVGLEIKREFVEGQLATTRQRVLPGLAALGGMAVPALIYVALNQESGASRGWAVPVATDIAFALGVLALLGKRVPISLKIFLTALAIIDDLLAVIIIALFYTEQLQPAWLAGAAGVMAGLYALNRLRIGTLPADLALGALLWFCTFQSGVHATLAGVALALFIPIRGRGETTPLHRLELAIQPWVAFLIIPIFGFANAGVSLAGLGLDALLSPVALGVAAGLFVGKQLGVFLTVWLTIRLRLADPPAGASMMQIYGIALLCGIGFTMSLFVGLLAFDDAGLQAEVKIGVLTGSLLSAIAGAVVLLLAGRAQPGVSTVSTASEARSG